MLPDLLVGDEHKALQAEAQALVRQGVPEPLALRGAGLLIVFQVLDITEISIATHVDPLEVARIYLTLSDRYAVDPMLSRISALPRGDRWQALARAALRYDLYAALEALTVAVLTGTPPGEPTERIAAWEGANAAAVARASVTLDEISRLEKGDLASLSVALRTLRGVVRATT
jgi:glutamate dehydrogenase